MTECTIGRVWIHGDGVTERVYDLQDTDLKDLEEALEEVEKTHEQHVKECRKVYNRVDTVEVNEFIDTFYKLQDIIYQINVQKGFWDEERSDAEAIALMHSELSEALESARKGWAKDDKIPEYTGVEAELADTIIRIMDFAGRHDLDIASALFDKLEYNIERPFKHGKKF